MADLGTDISCVTDLDPAFALVSGRKALGQAIARRLITARGALVDAPNYGTDLRSFLNDAFFATRSTGPIQQAIERECLQDERISKASALVTYNTLTRELKASITLVDVDGQPFQLVLAITAVTLTVLAQG